MGSSRRKESRKWMFLCIGAVGIGAWAMWIIRRHMGQISSPVSTPSKLRTQQIKQLPLNLPSLESITSKEGLPDQILQPWDDFVRGIGSKLRENAKVTNIQENIWNSGDAITHAGLRKCSNVQRCRTTWGNLYLRRWKMSKEIPKLCESNAASGIHCHDSPLIDPTARQGGAKKKRPTRFCEFTNVMLNFRKLRTYGGKRSFERGFLAASCGYTAPENIGINVYNPDVVSQSCDYVFNETVVVMSHSNIKRSWTVLKDYFVMFTMLQLAGVTTAEDIKKVTLLNIDSLVRGHASFFNNDLDDESKAFFYPYHALFRRVLRASQFPPKSTVCFRRLVWLSRPTDLHREFLSLNEGFSDNVNDECVIPQEGSNFFHRWSIFMRTVLGILPSSSHAATTSTRTKKVVNYNTNYVFQVLFDASLEAVVGGQGNSGELIQALRKHKPDWHVEVRDLSRASTRELIQWFSNSSLVMTARGAEALYGSAFMPLGTRNCCGVLEVGSEETQTQAKTQQKQQHGDTDTASMQSFAAHAKFMGHHHAELSIHREGRSSSVTAEFMDAVIKVESAINSRLSCVSTS